MDKQLYQDIGEMKADIKSIKDILKDRKEKYVTKNVFYVWTMILLGTVGVVGWYGQTLIAKAFN